MTACLRDRIIISELPFTEIGDFRNERRFLSKGGEFAQIVNEQDPNERYAHIAFWTSPAGGKRGDHVHTKPEHFYIVSGFLELHVADKETNEYEVFLLPAGTRVAIPPKLPHFSLAREFTQVIEYHTEPYAEENTQRFELSKRLEGNMDGSV